MTVEQAREEIPDIDTFCRLCCNRCTANDWYCPTECEVLQKARKLDFERIIKCYTKYDGDLQKVDRYIRATKINRIKGGY